MFDLIAHAGELLRSVPFILGYTPEESLVMVLFDGRTLRGAMRMDLQGVDANLDQMTQAAAGAGADGAFAVVVDSNGFHCPLCIEERHTMLDNVMLAMAAVGVDVRASFVIDKVAAGGRWCLVGDDESVQILEDPAESPMAVATVLSGEPVVGTRDDLKALVEVETARMAVVMELVEDAAGSDVEVEAVVASVLVAVRLLVGGGAVTDRDLAGIAATLPNPVVRDQLYALALSDVAGGAETLWALLARVLSGPWRVEALVLLCMSAYLRGDGTLAGIAVVAARRMVPGHRMASMLDTALRNGFPSEKIREVVAKVARVGVER